MIYPICVVSKSNVLDNKLSDNLEVTIYSNDNLKTFRPMNFDRKWQYFLGEVLLYDPFLDCVLKMPLRGLYDDEIFDMKNIYNKYKEKLLDDKNYNLEDENTIKSILGGINNTLTRNKYVRVR